MGVIARPCKMPRGDKFGLGAFGCGRKRLATGTMMAGSDTSREGGCVIVGIGTSAAANVGDEPVECGDIGVYGGGGAGFITMSGGGPSRFFFSDVIREGLGVREVEA